MLSRRTGNYMVCFIAFLFVFYVFISALFGAGVKADEVLDFTVLHTNDEHSALVPHSPAVDYHPEKNDPTVGGLARLAGAVNSIRSKKEESKEPVVLLSAGDFLGGTPFAWLNYRNEAPELSIFQEIGYDAVTIGNHEFDYGTEGLLRYLQAAGYPEKQDQLPLVTSNIIPHEDHKLNDMGFQKTMIKELENGLKLGLFGLIGENAVEVTPRSEGVSFTDQTETARRKVNQLQNKGAEIIILISHSGLQEEQELASRVEGIDLIIGGHSHDTIEQPRREGDTILVQAGSSLEFLGFLELSYDRKREVLKTRNTDNHNPFLVRLDDSITPDPVIKKMTADYTEQLNSFIAEMTGGQITDVFEPLAHSSFSITNRAPLLESPLGNLITDAMRLITEKKLDEEVDFAFQASNLIRGHVYPGSTEWGRDKISFYDLVLVASIGAGYDDYPGFPLASFYITGEELRRVLEISALLPEYIGSSYFFHVSGLRYKFHPGRTVLFNIPMIDFPIPSMRSVIDAEQYTGQGIQTGEEEYEELPLREEELYHVVSGYYLLYFVPLLGDIYSPLEIKIRDEEGNPVDSLEDTIIEKNDRELKLWEVLAEYTANINEYENTNENNPAQVPEYYSTTQGRAEKEIKAYEIVGGFSASYFNNQLQPIDLEADIILENSYGFYAGLRHELLHRISVQAFYERSGKNSQDYRFSLQGLVGTAVLDLIQRKGSNFYLKGGIGYYTGEYYDFDQKEEYSISHTPGIRLGLGVKDEPGIFSLTGDIFYRYLKPEFIGEDKSGTVDLSGIIIQGGLKYTF